MQSLFTAIALEVSFQNNVGDFASGRRDTLTIHPIVMRSLFVANAQADLATRSGIADPMTVPVDKLVQVLVNMAKDACRSTDAKGWVVHNPNGYKPSSYFKTNYAREFDAKRQAAKLRTRGYPTITFSTAQDYVRSTRYHLVRNMLNPQGGWVVEAEGTPGYLSVASEAYHSM